MTTAVTKESLVARIAELESGARSLKEDYTLAAYKILLATMEAEPVAWTNSDALADVYCGLTSMMGPEDTIGYTPLYLHAPPAPVVPEEMPCGGAADDYHDGYQDGWNACRAAMLNQL